MVDKKSSLVLATQVVHVIGFLKQAVRPLKNEMLGSRQKETIPSAFCYVVSSPSESDISLQKKERA